MAVIVIKLFIRNAANELNSWTSQSSQPLLFLATRAGNNESATQLIACLDGNINALIAHKAREYEIVIVPVLDSWAYGQTNSRIQRRRFTTVELRNALPNII